MEIIKSVKQMQSWADSIRQKGKTIGFVPTMGYLHRGHAKLIEQSAKECDYTVTSIFVNPTQFAPNEDFEKYPRDFERDELIAVNSGCDAIFYPDTQDMYARSHLTGVIVSNVTDYFEGEKRPTHFEGVATVVAKLFNIVKPHFAYFGQKDFQQTVVISRMVEDLNFDINIIIIPTVRESNGLAMSSRNTYLTPLQKDKAAIIFKALDEARKAIERGESSRKMINAILHKTLRSEIDIRIDYAEAVDAATLLAYDTFLPGDKIALLIACYMGKTRLIDNAVVQVPHRLNESNFIPQ